MRDDIEDSIPDGKLSGAHSDYEDDEILETLSKQQSFGNGSELQETAKEDQRRAALRAQLHKKAPPKQSLAKTDNYESEEFKEESVVAKSEST